MPAALQLQNMLTLSLDSRVAVTNVRLGKLMIALRHSSSLLDEDAKRANLPRSYERSGDGRYGGPIEDPALASGRLAPGRASWCCDRAARRSATAVRHRRAAATPRTEGARRPYLKPTSRQR